LFCEIPADSDKLSSSRQSLDEILKQYGTACKEQNEIDTYLFVKQRVHSEEADKEIGRHLCGGKYKKAFDVAKDYKNLEPKDEYEYYSKIRWIYQWQWEATPVYWKNYTQIENKVIESYNDWQNYCTTDDELDYYNHCYNEDFLRVKNEKEKEKKEWAKSASEYRQGTIEEGPLVIGNDGTSDNMIDDSSIPSESLYKQEVLLILQDGSIGDVERKFLERKRTKLGLTKEQAQKIEASCTVSLTDDEQEYVSIYRDLVEDGEPTGRLRKMLDREAEALGLSPERVSEIERTL